MVAMEAQDETRAASVASHQEAPALCGGGNYVYTCMMATILATKEMTALLKAAHKEKDVRIFSKNEQHKNRNLCPTALSSFRGMCQSVSVFLSESFFAFSTGALFR